MKRSHLTVNTQLVTENFPIEFAVCFQSQHKRAPAAKAPSPGDGCVKSPSHIDHILSDPADSAIGTRDPHSTGQLQMEFHIFAALTVLALERKENGVHPFFRQVKFPVQIVHGKADDILIHLAVFKRNARLLKQQFSGPLDPVNKNNIVSPGGNGGGKSPDRTERFFVFLEYDHSGQSTFYGRFEFGAYCFSCGSGRQGDTARHS